MTEPSKQLRTMTDEFQRLQDDLRNVIAARQQLDAQQQENRTVQKEFATLAEDACIYRSVGPVLLKQDKTEAVMAVDGRLAFIENETRRVEEQIEDLQEKSEKKRLEIFQLQTQMQQQQQQQLQRSAQQPLQAVAQS
ncbi:MAG: hypothetical protein M1826_006386 [Phylliscum demangeonii]|nr:MAG: hypothetical protein M1826_006386 [Phylliscum demangeonii]